MARIRDFFRRKTLNARERGNIAWLRHRPATRRAVDTASSLIVSLTTTPARIHKAWVPIELMLRQQKPPKRIVLVLARDEFRHQPALPDMIESQRRHGLDILWVDHSLGSYNKLLPTREHYPDNPIVTIDDDQFYSTSLLRRLHNTAARRPGTVIGCRGWELDLYGSHLRPYLEWQPAHPATPAHRCVLTGVGGILYPPRTLRDDVLCDAERARTVCPHADDIWFWAVATHCATPVFCLGQHSLRKIRALGHTPALQTINRKQGGNDRQLHAAINHFGLLDRL